MGGVTQTASVDANGNWSTNFAATSIPLGEYDTEVRVDVIDAAGNPDSISQTVRVDTLVNALSNSAGGRSRATTSSTQAKRRTVLS